MELSIISNEYKYMSSTFVSSTEGSVVFPVFEALYLNVPMYNGKVLLSMLRMLSNQFDYQ